MNETTYAPNNVIESPDVFEWSDKGGRYLAIRRRDDGELQVTTHAPDCSGLPIDGVDRWPTATFAVSTVDAAGFMAALMYWCRAATRCEARCYAGPGHQSKFQCELPSPHDGDQHQTNAAGYVIEWDEDGECV